MGSYTVKDTTSLVQISLQNQYPYIVYLPPLSSINSIFTIRDNDGLASVTSSILISTTSGTFTDGTTLREINQPYGFITFQTVSNSKFAILNSFAFPAEQPDPYITSLITNTLNYKDNGVYVSSFISSGLFFTGSNELGNVLEPQLASTVTALGTIGYLSSVSQAAPDTPLYVFVGSNIQYSIDGSNFTRVKSFTGNAITYGEGQFVAVGQDIQVSSDGKNWIRVPITNKVQVSYRRGLWHTVGGSPSILYSTDAQNWNPATNPLSYATGIAYGGVWVATGSSYMSLASIPWSRDGSNWNYANSFPLRTTTQKDVAFDGNQFIAVITNTSPTTPNIVYSVDGSNWSYTNVQGASVNNAWNYINGNGQIWLATGMGMSYSFDGLTWIQILEFVGQVLNRASWDGEQWWVGQQSPPVIWTSKDGIHWNQLFTGESMVGLAKRPARSETSYILPRTVAGLGSVGYISSTQLLSTVNGINAITAPIVQTVSTVFQYTGYNQIFNVPGNIINLDFYMWGAGGGIRYGGCNGNYGGGGAAFQQGSLLVNPFDSIQVIVGQGGYNGINYLSGTPLTTNYGGGGPGSHRYDNGIYFSGGGGGRSAIILNSQEVVTAGGGGGEGCSFNENGGDGGAAKADGTQSYSGGGSFPGRGGSSNSPGLGGGGDQSGQNAYYLHGGGGTGGGGGGGGGYFGGGGGGESNNSANTGGGGGGGSYYNPTYVQNFQPENGNNRLPGGQGSRFYQPGIGEGFPDNGYGYNGSGGAGLVVLVYTINTSKAQVSPEGQFQNLYIENLATNQIEVRQPHTPLYVATGYISGSNVGGIQYSTDGLNWKIANISPSFYGFSLGNNVFWNGSYWLSVSRDTNNGAIKYSQDGSNWLNAGIGTFNREGFAVTWNGQYWVAVGDSAAGSFTTMLYSYDGFTWLPASNAFSQNCRDVAWNGQMWVAVGYGATNEIKYSYNGRNWIDSVNGNLVAGYSVGWNGQLWVAMGLINRYSYDGSNWSNCLGVNFQNHPNAIAWNGSYWMAVGFSRNGSTIQVSKDGITWSNTLPGSNFLSNAPTSYAGGVTWDGRKWFITGSDSNTASIKYSGLDQTGNFIWIDATSGGFSDGGHGIAYNTPQIPFLQTPTLALYNRTDTQPLFDTPSNNFIKTTETSLNINNTLYVGVSSVNVTYINSKVGIFQPNPSFQLELGNGDAYKPTGQSWLTSSDKRVKENIQQANLDDCLSTLTAMSLRTYSYTSTFAEITGVSQEQRYGLIAQEVDIPHTVTKKSAYDFKDFHYLNTDQIHYIHLGATQALLQQREQQLSTTKGLLLRFS